MSKILCTRIGIDCCYNDPVDVRAGGAEILGFDFNVDKEKAKEMERFIVVSLQQLEVPIMNIYEVGELEVEEDQVWTKERILLEIQKEADFIKSEASRHYRRGR